MSSNIKMSRSEAGKLGALKSKKTQHANKLKRQLEYEKNPRKCANCHGDIPYVKRNNKFCGRSCSASFNNTGVCRNGVSSKRSCTHCGKPLTLNSRKFCDHICHSGYKWDVIKKQIESGEYMEKYTEIVIRPQIKRYLIEKNGHVCEICNNSEWMGKPIPLTCDHIDGNADNNKLTNFRIVCANCDRQLPTFGAKNTGNGRTWRRKNG